jgi:beta-N-acetylhexosaminidase
MQGRIVWLRMNRLDERRAFICGVSGEVLTDDERQFLQTQRPWGIILFARNIGNKSQLIELITEIRNIADDVSFPILIDQEGGRVARLQPPLVRLHPAAALYGQLYDKNLEDGLWATEMGGRIMADDLMHLGINIDCAPCLDVSRPETSDIIGNRAFSDQADRVAELGAAFARGLLAGGVLPVVKHIPGHGRGAIDSHIGLPQVDASFDDMQASDFVPFQRLRHNLIAMTGHLLFTALDPDRVSTCSPHIVEQIIRQEIGFSGLLMGDDVSMQALSGSIGARGAASIAAGCDLILHCNGDLTEMLEVAGEAPRLKGRSLERAAAVQNALKMGEQRRKKGPVVSAGDINRWGEMLSSVSP